MGGYSGAKVIIELDRIESSSIAWTELRRGMFIDLVARWERR